MRAFIFFHIFVSSAALSAPYLCHYGNSIRIADPVCEKFDGKVVVLCHSYVYRQNEQICKESNTHEHDLCEPALDQIQTFKTNYASKEACLKDAEKIAQLCDDNPPTPDVSGQVQGCQTILNR